MVYIIRHGKTTWNREGRLQGRQGGPLLKDEVERDAKSIKAHLENIEFEKFYISPLKRAVETFNILNLKRRELILDELLEEFDFGTFTGLKSHDEEVRNFLFKNRDIWTQKLPSGESYNDIYKRAELFIEKSNLRKYLDSNENVGILAHAIVNKMLIGILLGLEKEELFQIKQPHSCVYKISLDGIFMINHSDEWRAGFLKYDMPISF